MSSKNIIIRKAKIEDINEIANLIYYTEINPEDV